MKVSLWLFCAALLGCHRSSHPPESAPVKVPTVADACSTLADCDQGCDAGRPLACVAAGRLYEFGHGTTADAGHAYRRYERACTLGDVTGCYNVAVLLEAGKGVPRDVPRALELYQRVCAQGSKTACAKADAVHR
jgi:TPR repeat protein